MATGDQQDILQRLKSTLPPWFGDDSPLVDGILNGLAWAGSFGYSLVQAAKLQTRIKTATDAFLDLIAGDFFGTALLRRFGETDINYRARILVNLFRERGTRRAISRVLEDITGRTPIVFEPQRPLDTGAYGAMMGYGLAGGYGSMLLPFQCFVTAYRQAGSGVPSVMGYGVTYGGYGVPSQIEYANLSMMEGVIPDAEIYAAIDAVKPAATIIWTRISN